MKNDKISSLAVQLNRMENHPNIWSIDFDKTQCFKVNHLNGEIKTWNEKRIKIWASRFSTSEELYRFADWVRACLKVEELDKAVSDVVRYTGEIDDYTLEIRAEVNKENRIDVLSRVSGCTLVKKTQTFTSTSYVCEQKVSGG